MNLFNNKQDCCGCTACKNICPPKAIEMKSDEEGFMYPAVDKTLCTECSLCITVCQLKTEVTIKDHFKKPIVYAIKHSSNSVRMLSSSGGVYTAISDLIIQNKSGVCYGVEFDNDFNVRHKGVSTILERDKFRGSKYVQSDLGDIFSEVKHNLIKGKSVLFTGTPCQTAGLAKYLGISNTNTSNLILNDIICHGTPSPKLWKDYVNFIQKKNQSKLQSYSFRFKEKGWRGYNIKAEFENGQDNFNTKDVLKYVKLFNSNLILRPACYCCRFANMNRPSDIMIGDFWGIEKTIMDFEDQKGVSLVFINTKVGEEIFKQIVNNIDYRLSSTKDCIQLNLQEPTKKPMNREKFWKDYKDKGFNYIVQKYAEKNFGEAIRSFIVNILRHVGLISIIKKLLNHK